MKVLALGYIPKWKGGRQKTGLATGLFDLHDSVNALDSDISVTIAATDIFQEEVQIDHTKVIGWKKSLLVRHSILRFYRLPLFIKGALSLNRYAEVTGGFASILAKMIYLDYAIEKEQPDVIHLHACIYASFKSFIWDKSIPVVLRLHGINGYDPAIGGYLKYREIEKRITSTNFAFVSFVTGDISEDWKRLYGEFPCPMVSIINGYNENVFFLPNEPIKKKYDLVTISGLSERKGQDRVIKALMRMKEQGKQMSYLIVGNGDADYEKTIKAMVDESGLDVTFVPYVSQDKLNNYLWQSRYFILATSSEGFGKVFIESMAAGVPVILPANIPIAKEEGIFSTLNSVFMKDSTVESVVEVLASLSDMTASGREVADSVAHLSWKSIARQYLTLYHSIKNNET